MKEWLGKTDFLGEDMAETGEINATEGQGKVIDLAPRGSSFSCVLVSFLRSLVCFVASRSDPPA